MRIESDPAQTFSALFDLRGNAQRGELILTTPLGTTLAALRWAPGEAVLKDGRQTRNFESVDALVAAATGTVIPVDALFGWLAGRNDPVPGWRADLSRVGDGRIHATREAPLPSADLRIAFERG